MAEAMGILRLVGEADFSDLKRQLGEVGKNVDQIKHHSNTFNFAMDNAGKTINRATGALKEFAIFGAGLFAGLIATAPNLSGTFAEIGVTTREWAMELGEHAQPFLEALNKGAQDLLVSWTSLDEGTQTWITNLAL